MSGEAVPGYRLGLDIGGTKTHGLLLAPDGSTVADRVLPTGAGAEGVVASALDVANACCRAAGVTPAAVGVGIPGAVDPDAGLVRTAVNLGISELDLGPRLAAALGVAVTVENDVKAAALGALHHLDDGCTDLAYLNFGTGVAAAAVVGGRLVRGQGNVAGEIGHLSVDPAGDECQCGQHGCLEVLAGGGRIAERLARLAPEVTLVNLVAAARAGEPRARAEVERICSGIAGAVQVLVLTYGSPRVVVAGGVVRTAPGLVHAAADLLATRAARSAFLTSLDLAGRMVTLPPDYPVGAMGAALLTASF